MNEIRPKCHCDKHNKPGFLLEGDLPVWKCTDCMFVSFRKLQKCTTSDCKGSIFETSLHMTRCVCDECLK